MATSSSSVRSEDGGADSATTRRGRPVERRALALPEDEASAASVEMCSNNRAVVVVAVAVESISDERDLLSVRRPHRLCTPEQPMFVRAIGAHDVDKAPVLTSVENDLPPVGRPLSVAAVANELHACAARLG